MAAGGSGECGRKLSFEIGALLLLPPWKVALFSWRGDGILMESDLPQKL